MIDAIFYNKIRATIPTVCVDLLVTNVRNEYLLLRRTQSPAKGVWWFPGGRILKGETWRDACTRKAKEELGVALRQGQLVSVEESIFSEEEAPVHTVNIVVHMFFGDDQVITLDESHAEYSWQKGVNSDLSDCIKNPLIKFGFDLV